MQGRSSCALRLLLALGFVSFSGVTSAGEPARLHVGLSGTLFHEVPEPLVRLTLPPAEALITDQTQRAGKLVLVIDPEQLADQLAEGKLHLAVFTGVEFAWARRKNSQLRPLAIAANQDDRVRVHVLVRQDNRATNLGDLADRPLALPRAGRAHCRLLLERHGVSPGQCRRSASAEDALDDVIDGVAEAAIIDGDALACYQRRKPGRFAKLRELNEPTVFPAPIIAYQAGTFDDAVVRHLQQSLIKAHESARGKRTLELWKLTHYGSVPADYEQLLAATLKTYPPPERQARK